jgi:hypothetical protein
VKRLGRPQLEHVILTSAFEKSAITLICIYGGKNNKLSDSKNTESMLSDLEKSGSGAECEEQY